MRNIDNYSFIIKQVISTLIIDYLNGISEYPVYVMSYYVHSILIAVDRSFACMQSMHCKTWMQIIVGGTLQPGTDV